MRILQVCPHFYGGGIGGVVEYVKNISEGLVKRGHEVTVFCTDPRKQFPRCEVINGVVVERFSRLAPGKAYFFSLGMLLRSFKVKFDVVHAHCLQAFPFYYSILTDRKRLVLSPHYSGMSSSTFRNSLIKLLKPIEILTLKKADVIIAMSEYEKKLLCQLFNLNSSKIIVVPGGVDLHTLSIFRKKKSDFLSIVHVSRLVIDKGTKYLIEVLPRLSENVILEIVGRGPMLAFLREYAKKLGVSDRVKFYPNMPRHEVLKKYAEADLFILLSRYESYGMAVAEALAAGVPCIVTNSSALSEWIDNETCFGIDFPIDINKLAKLIHNIFEAKIDKRAMQKWMGTKILDWDDVTNLLENIYASKC